MASVIGGIGDALAEAGRNESMETNHEKLTNAARTALSGIGAEPVALGKLDVGGDTSYPSLKVAWVRQVTHGPTWGYHTVVLPDGRDAAGTKPFAIWGHYNLTLKDALAGVDA